MNKKIIVLSLILICAVSVFAQIYPDERTQERDLTYIETRDKEEPQYMWGFWSDYKSGYDIMYGLNFALQNGKIFFLLKEEGAAEKPTSVSNERLAQKNAVENELSKANRENELTKMISDAFKIWFTDTAKAIRDSRRTDEFADILPILDRAVKTSRVSNHFEQYTKDTFVMTLPQFYFTTQEKMRKICGPAAACNIGDKVITVNPYTKQKSAAYTRDNIIFTLVHEIGHWYGLADQYKGADNSDSEYSTGDDRVKYNRTSIMAGGYFTHLTCDGIDGFINLIDFTLSKQKKNNFPGILKKGWSDRAKNGWASFCNGKEGYKNTYYKKAKPVQSL